jgi:hypothetical protein
VNRRLESGAAHWRVFNDAELWVDAQAWEVAVARIASALTELDAAAKPPHTAGAVHVSATTMLFDIPAS